jgi:3-oxoadipate enol-lactonase
MPYLDRTTHRIHYWEANPAGAQPVVLLHGLGVTGESWQIQMPVLADAGFHVLAPSMRGCGRSSYPGKHGIAEMAADTIALLEAHNKSRAHLVGISMGGTVALQLALTAPHLVDHLALVNTFAKLKPDNAGVTVYFLFRLILIHILGLEAQSKAVAKRIFPYPEQASFRAQYLQEVLQGSPRAYRAAMRALARFDVSDQLGQIRNPTLVITGELDSTVPAHAQRELAEGIPNARHVVINKAGHAVSIDQSEAFNTVLLAFLSKSQ